MKKILKVSLVLLIFSFAITIFQISSCKKAIAETVCEAHYVQGLWTGTYTVDGQPTLAPQYFSFVIKPDGTLLVDTKGNNVQHLAIGTWTLNGNVLACSFTCVYGLPTNVGVSQTSTALFDINTGKITNGIWKIVSSGTGSGTFTISKI